jgi:hypothetical protein
MIGKMDIGAIFTTAHGGREGGRICAIDRMGGCRDGTALGRGHLQPHLTVLFKTEDGMLKSRYPNDSQDQEYAGYAVGSFQDHRYTLAQQESLEYYSSDYSVKGHLGT